MKVVGIYSGRFQPAHRGHLGVYNQLKQISADDTFVVTSDKVEIPKSPLNFAEKQQIWARHGVPSSHVVKVKNPYNPLELVQGFSKETAALVYALGDRDAERFSANKKVENNKVIWTKKAGEPSYFQPYLGNENNLQPLDKHGYIMIVGDVKIDGKPISGTKVREMLGSNKYNDEQKKTFFQWVFGWFDISLFDLLKEKFTPFQDDQVEKLKEVIVKIVNELDGSIGTIPVSSIPSGLPAGDSIDPTQDVVEKTPEEERKERELARKKYDAAAKNLEFLRTKAKYISKDKDQNIRDRKDKEKEINLLKKSI